MLLDGINHAAVLTSDTDRLAAFYQSNFDSTARVVVNPDVQPGVNHPPGTPAPRYHS